MYAQKMGNALKIFLEKVELCVKTWLALARVPAERTLADASHSFAALGV